ncbi:MAG TPA: M1 family aminopeptidase [Gemmatimonadales bacterium]
MTAIRVVTATRPYAAGWLVLSAVSCSTAGPDTSAGVSWQLAEHRAAVLSALRYDLAFTIPPTLDSPVTGTVTVRFVLADASDPVVLDFVQPDVHVRSVTIGDHPVSYEARNDHVVVAAEHFTRGENALTVDFVATETSLNRNPDFLYTLFVPDRARFTFPLFDQPNLKGQYTLTLSLPEGWRAVSNTAETVRESTASGVRITFGRTAPISSYLFSFAAGAFRVDVAERSGRAMRMYHRETDDDLLARNRDAIFDLHAAALDWLEDYTARPFPFDKFDFVLIPSFQYGGMEHPGAILYRAGGLLLEASATQNQLLGRARVIAHETAHMWFGDLVTMNWFDDVWTKEVFANFMAAKIVDPTFPDLDHELQFVLSHYPAAYEVDRTAGTNAIRQPLENLQDAGSLYGAIIYQKAPIVMRQLEARVGEEAFRDGLREYLATYAFDNATWPDLIDILDRRVPEDLTRWSTVWVEEAGRPRLSTHLDVADGRIVGLRIAQADPTGTRRWPQRLLVRLGYPDTARSFRIDLDGDAVDVGEAVGLPTPLFVLANGDGTGYGQFILDALSLAYLDRHLPDIDDPLVRGVGWLTMWDALLAGDTDPAAFLALVQRALAAEDEEANIQRILSYARETYWRHLTPEDRTNLAPHLEAQLWRLLLAARTRSLRAAYFGTLSSTAITEDAVGRLRRIWEGNERVPGLPLSERDLSELALQLAVRGPSDAEELLDRQFARIDNPDRARRFAFIQPALSLDPAVRDAFFQSLTDPANRAHEPWVLSAVSLLNHPLRASTSVQHIRPSLDLLEEIQRTGDIFFPLGWLNATLGGHSSMAAADIVRRFLEDRPDLPARLRGKLLQAADGLFLSAALRQREALPPGTAKQ